VENYIICVCLRIVHIVLCFCFVFRRLLYRMLSFSLYCPFSIASSVFSNDYLKLLETKFSYIPAVLCLPPLWWGDILFLSCPSVRLSVTRFVSATPLKLLNRISWNLVGSKDTICSCAYYQEILISWILWELCPFQLRNFPKFTTEAACQRNSSETTEQNFMKLGR
jgi:hypothetical protein